MGAVHAAADTRLGRRVAVKFLDLPGGGSSARRASLRGWSTPGFLEDASEPSPARMYAQVVRQFLASR
ncbi:hypothetical protein [Spirillospora sp. CA-128828]|uniref:hypothetical protein n=1 Tax=Spirillospora sp. CA-128828 TaxID=3240033 RepID=UPI003D8BEEC3